MINYFSLTTKATEKYLLAPFFCKLTKEMQMGIKNNTISKNTLG